MSGPLTGVRVIDMTANFMGPYASLQLAEMGADVCKIESPDGDTTRGVGPRRHEGMSAIFLHLNRNKRSVALDLKQPQSRMALQKMLSQADVLMYSLRPRAMKKLGLSYEEVRQINPRLIYCGATGFGQRGPYAHRPAYDDLIQAGVGMPVLQSRKSGPPEYVATAIADRVVGMAVSNAITAALFHREQTGKGQCISVPMFETFAHFVMGDHLYGHTFVPPIGDWGYARMMSPERRPYKTRDGYVGVQVYTDRHWQSFFQLIDRPDMAADPKYADIFGRTEHIGELYELLARTFETRSTEEWVQAFDEADIPIMPLHTPETLLEDPHMQAVGFFQEQEHPTEGRIRTMNFPQDWSESQPVSRYPAPRLGEHTAEVLREYGFSPNDIEQIAGKSSRADVTDTQR